MHRSRPSIARTVLLLIVTAAAQATEAEAQPFVAVPPPPNQPAAEGFDPERALFFAEPNFDPLRDPRWMPLADAHDAGRVFGVPSPERAPRRAEARRAEPDRGRLAHVREPASFRA